METIIKNALASSVLSVSLIGQAVADSKSTVYAIIVDQKLPKSIDVIGKVAGSLAAEHMQQRDTLIIYNGTAKKVVQSLTIPEGKLYNHAKFRIDFLRKKFAPTAQFVKGAKSNSNTITDNNLIGLQREFGDTLRSTYPDQTVRILQFGSPLYEDERQPAYSMRYAAYPNDANFKLDSTKSPFGTADRTTAYTGTKTHFCIADDSYSDETHFKAVNRTWSLYHSEQGGELATFTKDWEQCLTRFFKDSAPSLSFTIKSDDETPAMIQLNSEENVAVTKLERGTKLISELDIKELNTFVSKPHPTLKNIQVTTGIRYLVADYPKPASSWCYFKRVWKGVSLDFNVGTMTFGEKPVWANPTKESLRAGYLRRSHVTGAQEACQFPVN